MRVLEKELYFGTVPSSPLQWSSVRGFLLSFAPYKLITVAGNNFEYENLICVFTSRTKKKRLRKTSCGHLNFISNRAISGLSQRANAENDGEVIY